MSSQKPIGSQNDKGRNKDSTQKKRKFYEAVETPSAHSLRLSSLTPVPLANNITKAPLANNTSKAPRLHLSCAQICSRSPSPAQALWSPTSVCFIDVECASSTGEPGASVTDHTEPQSPVSMGNPRESETDGTGVQAITAVYLHEVETTGLQADEVVLHAEEASADPCTAQIAAVALSLQAEEAEASSQSEEAEMRVEEISSFSQVSKAASSQEHQARDKAEVSQIEESKKLVC